MDTYNRSSKRAVLRRLLEPKLDTPVRVMDETIKVSPAPDGHLESIEGEIGTERR